MEKYYICNGSGFVGKDGGIVSHLNQAQRFKMNEADSYLAKADDREQYTKQVAFTTGRKYVILKGTRFVGQSAKVVHNKETAKTFRSVADASAYVRSHGDLRRYIQDPVILSESLEAVGTPPVRKFTDEQLKVLGIAPTTDVATPRTKISPAIKSQIVTNSGKVCALCGKPVTEWDGTIDHIEPLSRGGKNRPSNLRYVHKTCNQAKGNMKDKEMYAKFTDIESKYVFENPTSDEATMMLRAYLRGVLRDYQQKGLTMKIWESTD